MEQGENRNDWQVPELVQNKRRKANGSIRPHSSTAASGQIPQTKPRAGTASHQQLPPAAPTSSKHSEPLSDTAREQDSSELTAGSQHPVGATQPSTVQVLKLFDTH